MKTINVTCSIYVVSLSDYNNGILHGIWIPCSYGEDYINQEIQEMLKTSPYTQKYGYISEEWVINDYSGFYNIRFYDYEDITTVCAVSKGIEKYGEAFAAYYNEYSEHDISKFEDKFIGIYKSEEDFASELLNSLEEIPKWLEPYIDYDLYALDLFLTDYFALSLAEGVAVFTH